MEALSRPITFVSLQETARWHDRCYKAGRAKLKYVSDQAFQLPTSGGRASDKRAQFVGVDANGWRGPQRPLAVRRRRLVSGCGARLVAQTVEGKADTICADGWKCGEVGIEMPDGYTPRQICCKQSELTAEQQVALDALQAEFGQLEALAELI
ncbi:hypothetical protein H8A95_35450 [Bradyrhizobium sp. Pear76]|uniref:hypothetical protein n=1 Tax=Bradyrhizobium oropedii TaxID=1571201 RepID=UPI001E5C3BDC|nr:hypothetical protein [Bradyrhizobium oropedii]MCC8967475.1 hypothetical protein [Bradyrhizobium oropedii]